MEAIRKMDHQLQCPLSHHQTNKQRHKETSRVPKGGGTRVLSKLDKLPCAYWFNLGAAAATDRELDLSSPQTKQAGKSRNLFSLSGSPSETISLAEAQFPGLLWLCRAVVLFYYLLLPFTFDFAPRGRLLEGGRWRGRSASVCPFVLLGKLLSSLPRVLISRQQKMTVIFSLFPSSGKSNAAWQQLIDC